MPPPRCNDLIARVLRGATFKGHWNNSRKIAFTLAEVLITLGIIGVVAAMTLPALNANYKKHEVETKLKRFYSNMNQAILLSENDNGPKEDWWDNNEISEKCNGAASYSEECLQTFFDIYLKKYIKYTNTEYVVEDVRNSLAIYFADGSVVKLKYKGRDWVFFINNKIPQEKQILGKTQFIFGLYPDYPTSNSRGFNWHNKGLEPYIGASYDGTTESLYKERESFAKIIQLNGWKIPKDYPLKF